MFFTRPFLQKLLALIVLSIFSCAKKEISYNYPNNQDYQRNSRAGTFLGKDVVLYGGKKSPPSSSSNPQIATSSLWKSSVQTIAALFPIKIIDETSGFISTDWYQDSPSANKRVKISAIIHNPKSSKKNLTIAIFTQTRKSQTSKWQDAKKDSSTSKTKNPATTLRDKILEKAS